MFELLWVMKTHHENITPFTAYLNLKQENREEHTRFSHSISAGPHPKSSMKTPSQDIVVGGDKLMWRICNWNRQLWLIYGKLWLLYSTERRKGNCSISPIFLPISLVPSSAKLFYFFFFFFYSKRENIRERK